MGSLRAGVREVTLIVIGIVIAFSLDAAWSQRDRRVAERDLLASLRTEMTYNLEELDRADSVRALSFQAAQALFEQTGPAAQGRPYSGVEASILRMAEGATTYEPRTGTINAIVNGGRLELVRRDSLRMALAFWQEQLRDVREEEDRCIDNLLEHFWPYLEGRIVFPVAGTQWEGAFDAATSAALLRDPTFAKHVSQQMHRIRLTMDDAEDLRVLIGEILRLVQAELPPTGGR